MPRHSETIRQIPGVNGEPSARYPGKTRYRHEVELKCYWCGRVMAQAGWWMPTDLGLALDLVAGGRATLPPCSDGHTFDVDGRWLWDAVNDATEKGYHHVTVPRRFASGPHGLAQDVTQT